MADPNRQAQSAAAAVGEAEMNDFQRILDGIVGATKPNSDVAKQAAERTVLELCQQAIGSSATISDNAVESIQALIAAIDQKLTAQVNEILHHEQFKTLEGAWRGLHHLVSHTETDEHQKIKVLNISKAELAKIMKKYKGIAFDQSPLFKAIYEQEYGMLGGHPFGCLVGDYYFDHSPKDVDLLAGLAKVAAAAHAPFIAAAAPALMGMESWQELNNPRDLTKIFQSADYAPWRSLRASEDARYIGLAMPRYLARLPYGAKTNPVEEFAFEEEAAAGDHNKYVWSNAAYAMAVNINRAFKLYGWCAAIRGPQGGGLVEGLPCHTFPTEDGGVDMKCPTEVGIPHRREAELAKNGFMPLLHEKNTDQAVFMGAQSLQQPKEYTDADATANAALAARLPYLFATCRFAHFLNKITYDMIGKFADETSLSNFLNSWIMNYVVDSSAADEIKAQRPLAAAEIKVEPIPESPGYYRAQFWLRPHYQLEGLKASLRLVSKLPSQKSGG